MRNTLHITTSDFTYSFHEEKKMILILFLNKLQGYNDIIQLK